MANGVRQGGILFPILFIDELLQRLANIGVGGHWKGMFASCLCYADDLALLAPSAHTLRRMLEVCSNFAMFNAGKTQVICICRHRSIVVDDCIEFCGQKLNFSDLVCHLDHMLACDLSDSIDIEMKTKEFIRCAN